MKPMAERSSEASGMPAATPGAPAHPSTDGQEADEQKAAAPIAPPLSLRVGPLTVRAGAAEVAAFRQETCGYENFGAPSDKSVPFTFPVRWFTHQDIRAAGAGLIGPEPFVPIHKSQSFDYEQPLEAEIDYQMTVDIIREFEPSRLILRAEIGDKNICLRAEMVLRIISTRAPEKLT